MNFLIANNRKHPPKQVVSLEWLAPNRYPMIICCYIISYLLFNSRPKPLYKFKVNAFERSRYLLLRCHYQCFWSGKPVNFRKVVPDFVWIWFWVTFNIGFYDDRFRRRAITRQLLSRGNILFFRHDALQLRQTMAFLILHKG